MSLPRAPKLLPYGPSNVEANLWIAFHDGVDQLSAAGNRRPAKPFNRNAALLPGAAMPTITPARQMALARRAVSERRTRRGE
jgi:hypothetical protein